MNGHIFFNSNFSKHLNISWGEGRGSRPTFRYYDTSSVLWNPTSAATNSCQLERVQRNCQLSYIHKIDFSPHVYSPVLSHLHLDYLADLRHAANLSIIHNLLNGKIDSPTLLSYIPLSSQYLLVSYVVLSHFTSHCLVLIIMTKINHCVAAWYKLIGAPP